MLELTARQIAILQRAFAAGFRPIAIQPYESALCLGRDECAAVLTASPSGGLQMLAPPAYLVEGNLSVKLQRGNREIFVWKKKELEATPERLDQLAKFRNHLTQILEDASIQ
jgi:hypothetical protein